MSATLWLNTAADETLELGGTLELYAAFAALAKAAGGDYLSDWPNLFGVVAQVESQEDADPEWLADVRREAKRFLREHGDGLDDHAAWVLGQLVGKTDGLQSRLGKGP